MHVMKNIFTILLVFFSFSVLGQSDNLYSSTSNINNHEIRALNGEQNISIFYSPTNNESSPVSEKSNILQLSNYNHELQPYCIVQQDTIHKNQHSKKGWYKTWFRVSMMEAGLGFGSGDNFKSNTINSGVFWNLNIGNYSMGFKKIGGIGFGTKVIGIYGLPNVAITSWFPVYLYLPIYMSKKGKTTNNPLQHQVPSSLQVFAGGSAWCAKKLGLSDSLPPSKYIHLGLNYMFGNYRMGGSDDIYANGHFSVEAGVLFYQYENKFKNGFYIGIIWAMGGYYRVRSPFFNAH